MKHLHTVYFVGFLLLFSNPLSAETLKGEWEVGLHGGISIPGGRSNDIQRESGFYQTHIEYYLGERLSLGLEGGIAPHHGIEGTIEVDLNGDGHKGFLDVETGEDVEVIQITPYIKIGKSHDFGVKGVRWFRSYVILGAGLYHRSNKSGQYFIKNGLVDPVLNPVTNRPFIDVTGQQLPLNSRTDNNFGINLGFGGGTRIFGHYRVGYDIRYHRIFNPPQDADYWVPTIRLSRIF